jgi:hypothetical protein
MDRRSGCWSCERAAGVIVRNRERAMIRADNRAGIRACIRTVEVIGFVEGSFRGIGADFLLGFDGIGVQVA